MSVYRICEECGAALDPGERCDCRPAAPLRLIKPGKPSLGGGKENLDQGERRCRECCG